MESPSNPASLTTNFLDEPPSCLEFCPTAPDHLVIGTYLLTQTASEGASSSDLRRTGSLQLFKLDRKTHGLTQIQRLSLEHAAFDLHFSPRDPSLVAVALSTTAVSLYRIELADADETSTSSFIPSINFIKTFQVHDDPSQLTVYLTWIPPEATWDDGTVLDGFAVSFSGGQVSVFYTDSTSSNLVASGEMSEIQFPSDPAIEVWYLAFNRVKDPGSGLPSLFSGDDFGQIREFIFPGPLTLGEREDENIVAPYQKSNDRGKYHGTGVTSILPLCSDDSGTTLVTGSYDGYIRVYRAERRGRVLTEFDLGGGVWRLNLIRSTVDASISSDAEHMRGANYYILASCMHAGARIVKLSRTNSQPDGDENETSWSFEVLSQFTEHTSMNYASDIWLDGGKEQSNSDILCVSSSFYDKRVCVWNTNI